MCMTGQSVLCKAGARCSKEGMTCQAPIGSCHETASLLMAHCDGLDAFALPQRFYQVYVLLTCMTIGCINLLLLLKCVGDAHM